MNNNELRARLLIEAAELLGESADDKEIRKRQIDQRVKQLEKVNDQYMTKHGEMNIGIYEIPSILQSNISEYVFACRIWKHAFYWHSYTFWNLWRKFH